MINKLEHIDKVEKRISTWNKWDLHIHTPSTNLMVSKDYKNEQLFTEKLFVDKMYENGIALGVITDHNIFDANKFKLLNNEVNERNRKEDGYLTLLPGVEINVKFSNLQKDPIHFILIFSENENLKNIEQAVKNLNNKTGFIKGKPKDATIDDIADTFSNFNYIVSIHLGKSSNKPRGDNYEEFLKIYIGGFVNICENNPSNKVENKEHLEKRVKEIIDNPHESVFIVGSDNHDISKYPMCENNSSKPQISFFKAIPSFEGLKMVITEPTRIFNSDNDCPPDYVSKSKDLNKIEAIRLESDKIGAKEIYFSRELNSIIGSRTSGKSLLLNIIKYALGKDYAKTKYEDYISNLKVKIKTFDDSDFKNNNSLQIEVFDQNRLMEEFEKAKSERDFFKDTYIANKFKEISLDDSLIKEIYNKQINNECVFVEEISNLFNLIKGIKIPNVYLKNYINFGKDTSIMSDFYLKISSSKSFKNNLKVYENKKTYLSQSINSINDLINNDKFGYIIPEYKLVLKSLKTNFEAKLLEINKKIDCLNAINKSNISKYKPFSVNEDFVDQHTLFLENIKNIAIVRKKLTNLISDQNLFKDRKFKVEGEYKYEKTLTVKDFVFSSSIEYKTKFYTKEEEPKHIVEKHFYIDDIKDGWSELIKKVFLNKTKNTLLFKSGNVESIINELRTETPTVYNTIIDSKGIDINQTSPGNRASVLISVILDNMENKILIIDQPEDNLDSKFIYCEIVKRLKELKKNRQIFLVTHNANIVVNSDSENIICCRNDDNIIKYEYGAIEYNSKIFENKNMKEFIMDNLEGTEEAFKLRNSKYFLKGENK